MRLIPWALVVMLLSLWQSCWPEPLPEAPPARFEQPAHFPAPHYNLSKNPVTDGGVALGRRLFYDGILSRDGSISCASCHLQPAAFADPGKALSEGIEGGITLRNSPALQNLAWQSEFFWDGGVFHLDLFALSPIENPDEMDQNPALLLDKLRNDLEYPRWFKRAFGTPEISTERFLKALSQFQLMMISAGSPYDRYMQGDSTALNTEQKAGLRIARQHCTSCHTEPLFSDFGYRNNGLPTGNPQDSGRARITLDTRDRLKFKTASLRNVAVSAPYMHDGRFNNLDEVLDHYSSGIVHSPTLDPKLAGGIPISATARRQLIAFLHALTDAEFLNRALLSQP